MKEKVLQNLNKPQQTEEGKPLSEGEASFHDDETKSTSAFVDTRRHLAHSQSQLSSGATNPRRGSSLSLMMESRVAQAYNIRIPK